jgi:hypothetical protein
MPDGLRKSHRIVMGDQHGISRSGLRDCRPADPLAYGVFQRLPHWGISPGVHQAAKAVHITFKYAKHMDTGGLAALHLYPWSGIAYDVCAECPANGGQAALANRLFWSACG